GLGKLVTGYDLLVQPAPDGVRFDGARLARLAGAWLARPTSLVARDERVIDLRALVDDVAVLDEAEALRLTAALGWDAGALLRATVKVTATGSARPVEVAKALGVWGPEDPRARHAFVARLGLRGLDVARPATLSA
ncbi:MAG TPA: hypothetical protein VHE35_24705, partial [Kofleriaceae bacterium]|nr:hypothetical protein [Kofleriaceae bacterium]